MTATPVPAPAPSPMAEPVVNGNPRMARMISNVLSPPVLALLYLIFGARASGVRWQMAGLYAMITVVVPLLDLVWLLRTGRITDIHLLRRRDRKRPFVVSITCTTIAMALMTYLGAPPLFLALVRAVLVQSVLLFAISLIWQVSVHSAAASGLATAAILVIGAGAAAAIVLVPIVAWARLRLRRHTFSQVVVGVLIGVGAVAFSLHGVL